MDPAGGGEGFEGILWTQWPSISKRITTTKLDGQIPKTEREGTEENGRKWKRMEENGNGV